MASRPSGLKAPSKIAKPGGGIPRPGSLQTSVKVEAGGVHASRIRDAVANSARAAGMRPSEANQHADKTVRTVNNGGPAKHSDEFIIGDRVIVGGNKHGHVQFLGETQFSSGEWAGVVLDEAIGKNDGSVNGIRYFQCEPKKGVFARADKLVRESAGHVDSKSAVGGIARHVPSTPRMGTRVSSPRSSMSKPPGAKPGLMIDDKQDPAGLKVGDRVLVSGSKLGTLRYTGTTEFAKGEWAGVELDEEQGKNDGAVAGTRYFQCKPKHGLFAPVHKVSKVRGKNMPRLSTSDGLQQGKLSTSSSSISSMGSSNTSSISRGLALSSGDLGSSPRGSVDSKKTQLRRPSESRIPSSSSKPRKEKEQSASSSTAAQPSTNGTRRQSDSGSDSSTATFSESEPITKVETAESYSSLPESDSQLIEHELAILRAQHQQYARESEESVESLKELVESGDREKVELVQRLEETQRQVDDLQFRIAEATITSTDLQEEHETESQKLKQLSSKLAAESKKTGSLEAEILDFKSQNEEKEFKIAELEMEASTYTEQMEELQKQLEETRIHMGELEARTKEGERTGEEAEQHRRRVAELGVELESVRGSKEELEKKVKVLDSELKTEIGLREERDDEIAELSKKLSEEESARTKLAFDVQGLKNALSDFERKCQASEERCSQLVEDKKKLENDIAELMKNSGNSSEQLVLMNEQIRTKDRRIEELLASLSSANQNVSRLDALLGQTRQEADEEARRQTEQHQQELQKYRQQMNSLQAELETSRSETSSIRDEMQKEIDTTKERLESELETIRKEKVDLESEKVKLDASAQELEGRLKETEEKLQAYEEGKASLEDNLKKTTGERDRLREERDQALADKQQLISDKAELGLRQDEADLKQRQVQDQLDRESQAKIEAIKTAEETKANVERVTSERDSALRDRTEALAQAQEREMKLETKSQEAETLRKERSEAQTQVQEQLTKLETLGKELEGLQKERTETGSRVHSLEGDLDQLRRERTELVAQAQECTIKVETREKDLEGLKKELERQREKEELLAKSSKEGEQTMTQLQTQLIERGQDLESSRSLVSELENKSSMLQAQLEELKKESDQKLQQVEQSLSEVRASMETVSKEKEALSGDQSSLGTQLQERNQECCRLNEEIKTLNEKMDTYQNQFITIESSMSHEKSLLEDERTKLSDQVNEKEAESARLQGEVSSLKEQVSSYEAKLGVLDSLSKEKAEAEEERVKLEGRVQEKEQDTEQLQEEIRSLKQQVESYETQLSLAKKSSSEGENNVGALQAQLAEARHCLTMEQEKVNKLETDMSNTQQDINALQMAGKEKEMLEQKNSSLSSELQVLQSEFESRIVDFEYEKESLQSALGMTNTMVAQNKNELDRCKQEIAQYQGESALASSYKSTIGELEKDKNSLQQQVSDLQTALVSSQSSPSSQIDVDMDGDPAIAKIQEDKEMAEGQVTFLNSVIVDLQRKNDELRARLEAMETSYMNGDHDDIGFDVDMDSSTHGPPPRLFCDICDVFDLHETEDCPLQASSDSPPATQYHGTRTEVRPYCDICEVFGHWTENCDDEQTY
eukprot:XP_011682670.1 PREDICTED: CAP-Gly domain-containing linker protein 1 isoform X1 [Strongylocentrotus purpuratus]